MPILSGLIGTLAGLLGAAVTTLLQLDVNMQSNNSDGSFIETALCVDVSPVDLLVTVNLASTTVGPNIGLLAVPIVNSSSAGITDGITLLGTGVVFLVSLIRRRCLMSVSAAT